jgi:hypothetical protein
MKTERKTAILVGACFLIAMVGSLIGAGVVGSVVADLDYPAIVANATLLKVGVLLELSNALAVLGIAILMYPILKQHRATLAAGYLAFRIVEAVFCSAIVIAPLAVLTWSASYGAADAAGRTALKAMGAFTLAGRGAMADLLIPVFFCAGALVFYAAVFQTRLLPRWISVWGFVAVVLVAGMNLVSLFLPAAIPLEVGLVIALPMILNEIVMGIWLIGKGFSNENA